MADSPIRKRIPVLKPAQPGNLTQPACTIRPGTLADIPAIQQVVQAAWPVAFGEIITPAFIAHELRRIYNDEPLKALMTDGERFLMAESGEGVIGFASYRITESEAGLGGKLEKLYLMPDLKGKGHGKALVSAVIQLTSEASCRELLLYVNRANPSVRFYEHMGFTSLREEDVEVGPGFFRNDYLMRLPLNE